MVEVNETNSAGNIGEARKKSRKRKRVYTNSRYKREIRKKKLMENVIEVQENILEEIPVHQMSTQENILEEIPVHQMSSCEVRKDKTKSQRSAQAKQEKVELLEEENIKLKRENEKLMKQLEQNAEEIARLKNDVKDLDKECNELQAAYNFANNELRKCVIYKKEADNLHDRINSMTETYNRGCERLVEGLDRSDELYHKLLLERKSFAIIKDQCQISDDSTDDDLKEQLLLKVAEVESLKGKLEDLAKEKGETCSTEVPPESLFANDGDAMSLEEASEEVEREARLFADFLSAALADLPSLVNPESLEKFRPLEWPH